MNKMKFNQNLLFKIFLTILLATVLTLGAVGFFSFFFTESILQNFIMNNELEIAKHNMNKIDRALYERYLDIQAIAGEESFRNYLLDHTRGSEHIDESKQKNNFKRIKDLAIVTGPWNSLFIIDLHGTIILSTLEGETGKLLNRWYYKNLAYEKAIKGELNHTDFVILKHTGEPAVVFAAPIRDISNPAKPVIGAVVGDLSWMTMLQILDEISANSILVNQEGDIIGSNKDDTQAGIAFNKSLAQVVTHKIAHGVSQSMIILKDQGRLPEDTLVSLAIQKGYLSYKGNDWRLVLSQPVHSVFEPANKSARQMVLVLLPIIILMSGGILLTVHRFVVYPITTLRQTIRDISSGDLTKQTTVISNDEIGQLAMAFNDMTQKLRESYEDLEEKVRQRTNELRKTLSELQKTNDDLKQTQLQLLQSEKLASIGQLAAGVAHEINNPVGFISNNMEILQDYIQNYTKILRLVENIKRYIGDGDIKQSKLTINELKQLEEEINLDYMMTDVNKLLEHSGRGLERIKKIVMDLRTFAREDKAETMELIKIEEVIDSILSIVQNELKYKAELTKDYGNTVLVKGNPQRLGQVFINLLVNASQAIKDKGKITIKTYPQGQYVCIDVIDTGEGIPAENLKKIFDPFFTTKPIGQGTGLGLSVSYEIIKQHHGEIKVQSQVGKGTTFTVMLPIS